MFDSVLFFCFIFFLVGGCGQCMGGCDKGLIEWQGLFLIVYLYCLVCLFIDDLIVFCNCNQECYVVYVDCLVSDDS